MAILLIIINWWTKRVFPAQLKMERSRGSYCTTLTRFSKLLQQGYRFGFWEHLYCCVISTDSQASRDEWLIPHTKIICMSSTWITVWEDHNMRQAPEWLMKSKVNSSSSFFPWSVSTSYIWIIMVQSMKKRKWTISICPSESTISFFLFGCIYHYVFSV